MGRSYAAHTSVSARVFSRLPVTIELAVAASVVAVIISIPLGIVSATRRNQPADYAATTASLFGISTPDFWLGLMLVLVFAVHFGWLPTSGTARYHGHRVLFPTAIGYLLSGTATPLIRWFQHIIMPAVTLGTYFTALITRLTRSGMIDELGQSYVRALRGKGLPPSRTRYRHVLKNTLIPIITVVGLQLGTLIGGAVVTEYVFSWHGLGSLVVNAIHNRAWMTIQGSLIVIGVGFVIVNIAVDALYAYINPQVAAE